MRRWSPWVCLAMAAGIVPTAHAADGLVWQWPEGETRRYRLKADLQLHQAMFLQAEYNKDSRVYDLAYAVDLDCKAVEQGKGFLVTCDIDDAQLTAAGEDPDNLLPILDEWDGKLTDSAKVQLTLTEDGRVKEIDLLGLNERNQRIRLIKETMHALLSRGLSAFDLQLPKKGNDEGESWKQKSELVMQLPILVGGVGSSQLRNEVSGDDGGLPVIDTTGRGSLMIGEQISGPGDTRPPDVFDFTVSARGTFDPAKGMLVSRAMMVQGTLTPGSGSAMGTVAAPYILAADLQYVAPGTPSTMLGNNAVRPMKK